MYGSIFLAATLLLSPLQTHIGKLLHAPAFSRALVGAAVYDLDHHRMVYAYNADKLFLAASTTKLLTEGAALAMLGPAYRFHTNVYRTGSIDVRGTLHGNIVLRASGDPNLSGRLRPDGTLAYENTDHSYDGDAATKAVPGDPLYVLDLLAKQIRAHGIRAIEGRVIVDDSLYGNNLPEAGTGAVISPVMVNDNIVDVTVAPGKTAGEAPSFSVSPKTAYTSFINRAQTCSGKRASIALQDTEMPSGAVTVTISGCIPLRSQPVLYAYDVASPRRFAEIAFTGVLARDGVAIEQSAGDIPPDPHALAPFYTETNIVAAHVSPPLREDVKVTLKVSDNLHADTMPYIVGNGSAQKGLAREREWLEHAHLDAGSVVQNDGLGGSAYMAPAFMVRYLEFMRTQPFFDDVAAGLPVLGRDGTLWEVLRSAPAAGHAIGKTGTWNGNDVLNSRDIVTSKGMAGYVTTRRGLHLAYCFYVNNFAARSGDAALQTADLLGSLANAAYLYGG